MRRQAVPGSFSLMKKMNTSFILNTIRERGPISRAEVAKITGLTPATVTNITAELIKYHLVLEAERGESSGGRKPVMLRINTNSYYVVGVYIGSPYIDIVVSNFNSDSIYSDRLRIDTTVSSEVVLNNAAKKITDWMEQNRDKKILGVGIGVHGLVQSKEGISIYAPNLGWENVPVKEIFQRQLGIPVFVDNDVRTMTLGESWFGLAKNVSNFVFMYVGYGIGGSIVIDNQLYRGTTEGAGEIGHTTIEIDGPRCSCGNHGCLQAMASEPAIVEKIKEMLSKGESSIIKDWVGKDFDSITPDMVYDAALKGDNIALSVVKEKASYLGVAIANLINTFNPSMVIINGSIVALGDVIMNCIQEEVQKRSMKYLQNSTKITFSNFREDAILKGAVALVLSETFENPELVYSSHKV